MARPGGPRGTFFFQAEDGIRGAPRLGSAPEEQSVSADRAPRHPVVLWIRRNAVRTLVRNSLGRQRIFRRPVSLSRGRVPSVFGEGRVCLVRGGSQGYIGTREGRRLRRPRRRSFPGARNDPQMQGARNLVGRAACVRFEFLRRGETTARAIPTIDSA